MRLVATGFNRGSRGVSLARWKVRNGHLKMVTGKIFPRAMGSDFSGTVTRCEPGDAVFGLARLKESGALGPTARKFLRAIFNRQLKPTVCARNARL